MSHRRIIQTLFLLGLVPACTKAQTDSIRIVHVDSTPTVYAKQVPQEDISDAVRRWFKAGPPSPAKAAKVGKPLYSVVPAVGYTLSTGLAAIISGNVAFYTYNPDSTNLSSILASVVYTQKKQITVPIIANIWTKNNKYNIVTDWRFFKYPQDTYGLGGLTKEEDANLIDNSHIRLHQAVLRRMMQNVYAGVGYFLDYRWNIHEAGLPDSSESDAQRYGLPEKTVSSGPVVNILYDSRKNSINADKGAFVNLLYRPSLTLMGSDNNWQSLALDIRTYFHFPKHSRNVLAFWNLDWLTLSGKPPYLDLPATGWDITNNTGRGYIQGRFRSPNMLYLESEYRMVLTRNGLLGAVLFVNGQSFSEWPSNSFETIAPGFGLGIRVKFNKNSNTNLAVDYGFGLNGSRGLFVNVGEIF